MLLYFLLYPCVMVMPDSRAFLGKWADLRPVSDAKFLQEKLSVLKAACLHKLNFLGIIALWGRMERWTNSHIQKQY